MPKPSNVRNQIANVIKKEKGTKKGKPVNSASAEMPPEAPPSEPVVVSDTSNEEREIIYPTFEVLEYSTNSEHGPVTPDDIVRILGWQTETDYVAQMMKQHPNSKREDWLFLDDFHCLDTDGTKVRCWNNANNRRLDMEWCKKLLHTILWGNWAGPLTVPGETINGETIRISKYGMVLSGQHQGTALKLADEWLKKSRDNTYTMYYDPADPETEKYKFWIGKPYPVIETLIVTGLSEDERVLRTIDYVKTRTIADMLYTMPLFKCQQTPDGGYRNSTPQERDEMTRMLASAIDLLWIRTEAKGYKTHPEIVLFLDRHMRLLKCVEHLFLLNRVMVVNKKRKEGESEEQHKARVEREEADGGRRISKLHLNAGQCAALMYLMGASATDDTTADEYRNSVPPNESMLDWSMWDKAECFMARLAGDRTFIPVRIALNRLVESDINSDENQGLGGRFPEKLAIIAMAWDVFKSLTGEELVDPFPSDKDEEGRVYYPDLIAPDGALSLAYSNLDEKNKPLPEGKIRLVNVADFFGIDVFNGLSNVTEVDPPAPSQKDIDERGRKLQDEKIAKEDARNEKKRKKEEVGSLDKLAARASANLGNTKKK